MTHAASYMKPSRAICGETPAKRGGWALVKAPDAAIDCTKCLSIIAAIDIACTPSVPQKAK